MSRIEKLNLIFANLPMILQGWKLSELTLPDEGVPVLMYHRQFYDEAKEFLDEYSLLIEGGYIAKIDKGCWTFYDCPGASYRSGCLTAGTLWKEIPVDKLKD